MPLSDEEKRAIREEVERLVDQAFMKLDGRTWREAATTPAEKNGDSVNQVTHDFPALFSE